MGSCFDGIDQFSAFVNGIVVRAHPERLFLCADVLRELAASGAVAIVLNRHLQEILSSPDADSVLWNGGVLLAGTSEWSLRCYRYYRKPSAIYTLPYVSLVTALSGRMPVYNLYDLPADYVNAEFSCGLRLGPKKEARDSGNGIIRLDGRSHAIDPDFDHPVVVLRLDSAVIDDLQWRFDRNTLRAEHAISTREEDSQLVAIANVLGAMGDKHVVEALALLSQHPRHFVRWAAIINVGRISREAALDLVRLAITDTHPEIRTAAKLTLARAGA